MTHEEKQEHTNVVCIKDTLAFECGHEYTAKKMLKGTITVIDHCDKEITFCKKLLKKFFLTIKEYEDKIYEKMEKEYNEKMEKEYNEKMKRDYYLRDPYKEEEKQKLLRWYFGIPDEI